MYEVRAYRVNRRQMEAQWRLSISDVLRIVVLSTNPYNSKVKVTAREGP
jgi:hypothetical protein